MFDSDLVLPVYNDQIIGKIKMGMGASAQEWVEVGIGAQRLLETQSSPEHTPSKYEGNFRTTCLPILYCYRNGKVAFLYDIIKTPD